MSKIGTVSKQDTYPTADKIFHSIFVYLWFVV